MGSGPEMILAAVAMLFVFMLISPFFVFLCAKLGAYGFLVGRYKFEEDHGIKSRQKEKTTQDVNRSPAR